MGCSTLKLVVETAIAVAPLMRDIICCKIRYDVVSTGIQVPMLQRSLLPLRGRHPLLKPNSQITMNTYCCTA